MALQHYLKNTENYCVTAVPAAAQTYTTTSTTATTGVIQQAHLQLQHITPAITTTTAQTQAAATVTAAATHHPYQQQRQQQQLHHLTLHHQQQQQQHLLHHIQSNTTTPTTIITTNTQAQAQPQQPQPPQPQQQLLVQSQHRLKQLQLKQPTIHQQHTTYHHHHPYYQQSSNSNNNNNNNIKINNNNNNTTTVINKLATTGAVNHKFKSAQQHHNQQQQQIYSHNRTLPIHAALNQNSNFSAASSSTGGGTTASSHAPTQQSNATNSSRSSAANNGRTTTATNNANKQQQQGAVGAQVRNGGVGGITSVGGTATNSKKIRTEPLLSQYHQTERLTFANSHIIWGEEHWRRVVFQDERKFNLDGPDGFSSYFHDLRNYEQTLSQRPRGNSVYIYILLTVGGPIHLEVSTVKQRPQTYIETILRERSNIITKLGGNPDFILQDHNWTANLSPTTQELLEAEGIKMQRWPTIAHDVNIMENIWGWLVREVYDGGRKFARKDDLIFRIRSAWTRLPMDFVVNLYSTLPERIAELYYTRGIYTNC